MDSRFFLLFHRSGDFPALRFSTSQPPNASRGSARLRAFSRRAAARWLDGAMGVCVAKQATAKDGPLGLADEVVVLRGFLVVFMGFLVFFLRFLVFFGVIF